MDCNLRKRAARNTAQASKRYYLACLPGTCVAKSNTNSALTCYRLLKMKEFLSIIWHKRVIVTPKKERQRVSISNVEWFSASFSRNMLYSIVIIELTALHA